MNESETERKIVDLGLTAPRLTPQAIDEVIKAEGYYIFPGTQVTICCLTLENGFNVIGHSACVSPENFDHFLSKFSSSGSLIGEQVGREIARREAREKIWFMEGYLLKQRLYKNG